MEREKVRTIERSFATIMKMMSETAIDIPDEKKKQIIDELRTVTASDRVSDDPHVLAYYRGGEFLIVNKLPKNKLPDMVVYPTSDTEIKDILKIATKYKIPVSVCCLQSTFISARALTGGILIDLMKMDKVHKIDTNQGFVVVEPGVPVNRVQEQILPKGYTLAKGTYYPNFSIIATTIPSQGHNNLINRMVNQIIGIEVLTADGSTIITGSQLHRDSEVWADVQASVPQLTNLFSPTWGTLGIVTKAAVRIWPILEERAIPVFGFDNFESAFRWSHAMSKSSMADTVMNMCWNYVGGMNYKLTGRYLDYLEARINVYQDETPKELNLYNYFGWVQMRGYEEEITGAVATAKRLAKQFDGVYIPEDELQEKLPAFYKYMINNFKEFTFSDADTNSMLHETPMFTDQFLGSCDEIIRLYKGFETKFQDYNYKNWGGYSRQIHQGQTSYYRYFPNCDDVSQEDILKSASMVGELSEYALNNYDVSVIAEPFRYNDPENPEEVTERAKPVRRLMRAVQDEFDPENILTPIAKKYTLL